MYIDNSLSFSTYRSQILNFSNFSIKFLVTNTKNIWVSLMNQIFVYLLLIKKLTMEFATYRRNALVKICWENKWYPVTENYVSTFLLLS